MPDNSLRKDAEGCGCLVLVAVTAAAVWLFKLLNILEMWVEKQ